MCKNPFRLFAVFNKPKHPTLLPFQPKYQVVSADNPTILSVYSSQIHRPSHKSICLRFPVQEYYQSDGINSLPIIRRKKNISYFKKSFFLPACICSKFLFFPLSKL